MVGRLPGQPGSPGVQLMLLFGSNGPPTHAAVKRHAPAHFASPGPNGGHEASPGFTVHRFPVGGAGVESLRTLGLGAIGASRISGRSDPKADMWDQQDCPYKGRPGRGSKIRDGSQRERSVDEAVGSEREADNHGSRGRRPCDDAYRKRGLLHLVWQLGCGGHILELCSKSYEWLRA